MKDKEAELLFEKIQNCLCTQCLERVNKMLKEEIENKQGAKK